MVLAKDLTLASMGFRVSQKGLAFLVPLALILVLVLVGLAGPEALRRYMYIYMYIKSFFF